MTKLPLKFSGHQPLLLNLGLSISASPKSIVLSQISMRISSHENRHAQTFRNFSTSNPLQRSLYKLALTKSRVNMQKTKQLQFTSDYIQSKVVEYNLGTRRLALMMGKDPETFSKSDIDTSIEYLFPSDLAKDVLPSLKHPEDVYPPKTVIKMDEHGKPISSFFYTRHPDYYELMHEIYEKRLQIQRTNNKDIAQKIQSKKPLPEDTKELNLRGTTWITKEDAEKTLFSHITLSGQQYYDLIGQVSRLMKEPKAYLLEDYIKKFRKEIIVQVSTEDIPHPRLEEDGRYSVEANGERKTSKATVKLTYPGRGKITVNGKDFSNFFFAFRSRELVVAPFSLLGYQRMFDVEAQVDYPLQINFKKGFKAEDEHERTIGAQTVASSRTAHAVAIRMAIANALRSFVHPQAVEVLRMAGLLQYDIRNKERKVPGKRSARKRFTWKKR